MYLDKVSTTCDSGWVREQHGYSVRMNPPANAGGTDRIQERGPVTPAPSPLLSRATSPRRDGSSGVAGGLTDQNDRPG
jgi:hypothetical protein